MCRPLRQREQTGPGAGDRAVAVVASAVARLQDGGDREGSEGEGDGDLHVGDPDDVDGTGVSWTNCWLQPPRWQNVEREEMEGGLVRVCILYCLHAA